MEPEISAVIAETNLRRQHKYRSGWNKADQADENRWTKHDREHEKQLGFRYSTCPLCWPKENDAHHQNSQEPNC